VYFVLSARNLGLASRRELNSWEGKKTLTAAGRGPKDGHGC
jgi:hypothetical protein